MAEGFSTIKETKVKLTPSQQAELDKQFTLEEVDPLGRTEVLIYGPPGSGKTVLAATMEPPFRWIAADGQNSLKSVRWAYTKGLTSIKDLRSDLVGYVPSEDFAAKGSYVHNAQAFNRMQDMIDFWFSSDEVGKWKTLVIDSATELNDWTINLGLGLNAQLPSPQHPLSSSHTTNMKAAARVLTGQQDYKSAMALFEGWLSDTRGLCARHDKALAVLCHEWTEEREREDGTMTVIRRQPLLTGQLRTKVSKNFDDVWYMVVRSQGGKMDVKVQVHEDSMVIAKTRWGDVLDKLEEPSYQAMLAKVKKYHNL